MSAHAAVRSGADIEILSLKRKSPLRGAQYLHHKIPGTPAYEIWISYQMTGTPAVYRDKVYGPESDVRVSPESLLGETRAWDIRAVYDRLWALYGYNVKRWEADPEALQNAMGRFMPDVVISTIPAYLLCKGGHNFDSVSVLVSEDAPDIPIEYDNTVVCSGRPEHTWYRQSRICGWENTEYAPRNLFGKLQTNDLKLVRVTKPLSTDCNCFPEVVRMGRYGRWEKGVLSDTAYRDTELLVRGGEHD
jgi:hypothetical protein